MSAVEESVELKPEGDDLKVIAVVSGVMEEEDAVPSPPGQQRRAGSSTPHAKRKSHFLALIEENKKGGGHHEHHRPPALLSISEDDEEIQQDLQRRSSRHMRTSFLQSFNRPVTPPGELTRRESAFIDIGEKYNDFQASVGNERLVQVNLRNYSYHVPVKVDAPSIKTVMNQSVCYSAFEFFHRMVLLCQRGKKKLRKREGGGSDKQGWEPVAATDLFLPFEKKAILSDLTLCFEPGKTYLILAPPGGGKTTLLKAISGLLPTHRGPTGEPLKSKPHSSGRIEFNGVSKEDEPGMILPNIVSFVGQLDNHAPYLTVKETFEFAFQCRTGGHHASLGVTEDAAAKLDKQDFTENLTIEGLDLAHCADTFVGNDEVRGVSGGQRRRVTVGEMMQGQNPVACCDEISTGLDAAVTYDIVHSIVNFSKKAKTTRIISLLQAGPETVSLFDEIVLLAEGQVVYAGPIEEIVDYFADLGYQQPATMDVGDYVQSIPTPDGALFHDPESSPSKTHMTAAQLAESFKTSPQQQRILEKLDSRPRDANQWIAKKKSRKDLNAKEDEEEARNAKPVPDQFMIFYQNSFFRSLSLNFFRHLTLWKRDKGYIIGKLFENIGMAAATGGILFGTASLKDVDSIDARQNPTEKEYVQALDKIAMGVYGSLFMTTFHILLGTMTSTPDEVDGRSIHYKHDDANFYQPFAFVFGRLFSTFPQRAIEITAFGIPLYWMVGLDQTAGSFFIYLALLICYTIGIKLFFSILAQTLPKKANVQGVGTFIVLIACLFSGFIVYPNTIPDFYQWLYWMNPMAWCLQGLVSIEFTSNKYEKDVGEVFLDSRGFKLGREWIGYAFAYMVGFTILSGLALGVVLMNVRIEPEVSDVKNKNKISIGDKAEEEGNFNLPFTPVDLSFEKIVYTVKSSTTNEDLQLLNEVSGVFAAGRMVALMGSSGAGKTTLMDVIAMRKDSGTTTGEVYLNGFPQERKAFLRVSGYVEQFDVQQPELTVWETVEFCALLRLDADDPGIKDDNGKRRYVSHVLQTMELTDIQTLQVGSYEEGGLTFEQRKRLAIACELAGSPSVIFLDEPTSGLDSRGALVVIRAMKRIADTGRTVCSTIHQPSGAVFEMFDDLLLLTKGGNTVFFGELGPGSSKLIEYFEARGAIEIEFGENPAAWMLRAQTSGPAAEVDWPAQFKASDEYQEMWKKLEACRASPDETKKLVFEKDYPVPGNTRLKLMVSRIMKIYKRSPAYNLARLMIAIFYAFIIGSVFLTGKDKGKRAYWKENELDGVLSTMFLSLIIIGVTSISMAVPVAKTMRDVFYKHRASGMITHKAVSWALFVGEIPYLIMISFLFGMVYYLTIVGLFKTMEQFWYFFLFFGLNVAAYAYFGQAFICLVRDTPTAGALMGALIGFNVFFSGLIVRPQYFVGPFLLGFWTAPGRFAYEGLVITQFDQIDDAKMRAKFASSYFFHLGCNATQYMEDENYVCESSVSDYVDFFFGGKFTMNHFWIDFGVLMFCLLLARIVTYGSLWKFNYSNS